MAHKYGFDFCNNFIDLYFKVQKYLMDNFFERFEESLRNMFIWDRLPYSAVDLKDG